MDVIPSQFRIENRLAEQAAQDGAPGELDRDAFLNLLIAQLENQDPLSPMQDHEFVAQLATFSSLEQLESMNASLQASLLVDQSVNNSLVTNLIGKEVLADGSTVRLGTDGQPSFTLDLPAGADVTLLVRDALGNTIRRIDGGSLSAGRHDIVWDGLGNDGVRAPSGDYRIEVVAQTPDGDPVQAKLQIRARVDGVRFDAGAAFLVVGDAEIPLSSVLEVFARSEG